MNGCDTISPSMVMARIAVLHIRVSVYIDDLTIRCPLSELGNNQHFGKRYLKSRICPNFITSLELLPLLNSRKILQCGTNLQRIKTHKNIYFNLC